MKSLFIVLWLAIIALIVLLGSCEKPRMFVQDGMYIDSAKCKTIVIRDGQLVTGHKTISGCVFRVSDLIKERDSLQCIIENLLPAVNCCEGYSIGLCGVVTFEQNK